GCPADGNLSRPSGLNVAGRLGPNDAPQVLPGTTAGRSLSRVRRTPAAENASSKHGAQSARLGTRSRRRFVAAPGYRPAVQRGVAPMLSFFQGAPRPRPASRSQRPRLEQLEDRTVPSGFFMPSKVGVVRPTGSGVAQFSLDSNGNGTFDAGDSVFSFGLNSDHFLV